MTGTTPDLRAFLLTDLEGSSLLWLEHRAAMQDAVAAHDAVMREAIGRYGGEVFKTAGDAFFASFGRPSDAVLAACDAQIALAAQSWPGIGQLKARAAVHVGTAERRDGDYFGPAVNRCARLLPLAHGGQVLVTASVAELLASEREVRAPLRRLGERALDDPKQLVGVHQVVVEGLPQDFPPLRSSGAATVPLLAVLAFDNLSGDGELTYFSDGVSEEILQTVARGADLKVIGRSSSFQLRGPDKAAARVAKALGATHVLDGSVRRSGARVRIAASLIECAGETTLWSERFDRDLADVFALQDEIAAAVAAALNVVFRQAPARAGIDPAAYDRFLRAVQLGAGAVLDDATLQQVIALFEEAAELAPGFARAWDSVALTRATALRYGTSPLDYDRERALVVKAAQTALRLDPGLGGPHHALAMLEPFGDFAARDSHYRRALIASPGDPGTLVAAAFFASETGRIGEALELARRAFELDPMQPAAAYSYASFLDFQGRHPETRELWATFTRQWPQSNLMAHGRLAAALQDGDWTRFEAWAAALSPGPLTDGRTRGLLWLGRSMHDPQPTALARALERAKLELATIGTVALDRMTSLASLGLVDETFQLIERASFAYMFDARLRWASAGLSGGFIFSRGGNGRMMADPRFVGLCAKLGLCDYWVASGKWPDCADQVDYDFRAEARRLAGARG